MQLAPDLDVDQQAAELNTSTVSRSSQHEDAVSASEPSEHGRLEGDLRPAVSHCYS